jgi:hypothetical protein
MADKSRKRKRPEENDEISQSDRTKRQKVNANDYSVEWAGRGGNQPTAEVTKDLWWDAKPRKTPYDDRTGEAANDDGVRWESKTPGNPVPIPETRPAPSSGNVAIMNERFDIRFPVSNATEAMNVDDDDSELSIMNEFDNLLIDIKARANQETAIPKSQLPAADPRSSAVIAENEYGGKDDDDDFIIDTDAAMPDGCRANSPSLISSSLMPMKLTNTMTEGGAMLGYKKLQELSDCLSVFNPRDELQIQAQKKFTCCALRHIFGDVFDALRERLAREFNMKRLKSGTIVYMPRRHGKTWSVAQFAAAYTVMLTKYSSFVIELIAHGIKQTSMLMNCIKDHIDKLKGTYMDFSYSRDNTFELWIFRNGHVSKIRCWTDSLSHTLGLGGNGLIILDEAVQMPMRFFIKNIKPMLAMAKNSIAICSSPGDQDNWVTRLMNVKDDNEEQVLDVLNQVEICKECMKLPFNQRIDCPHARPPPFWLSKEKQTINKTIAKAFNAIGTHLVEEQGMVGGYCESPSFDSLDLEAVFAVPYVAYGRTETPEVLYISVDVGAGKSRTAVISSYVDGDKIVVCSMFVSLLFIFSVIIFTNKSTTRYLDISIISIIPIIPTSTSVHHLRLEMHSYPNLELDE